MDPDQLASQKPDDLKLQCFQNRIYSCSVWYGLLDLFLSQSMRIWELSHGKPAKAQMSLHIYTV